MSRERSACESFNLSLAHRLWMTQQSTLQYRRAEGERSDDRESRRFVLKDPPLNPVDHMVCQSMHRFLPKNVLSKFYIRPQWLPIDQATGSTGDRQSQSCKARTFKHLPGWLAGHIRPRIPLLYILRIHALHVSITFTLHRHSLCDLDRPNNHYTQRLARSPSLQPNRQLTSSEHRQ